MEHRRICPECGALYSPGQRYCTNEGTELVAHLEAPLPKRPDPLISQVLDGRYRIKRVLGEGGMGTVYVAQHLNIEKLFAIKILKSELRGNDLAFRRFQREARVLSRLSHPHIVTVHDYGQTPDGCPYLAMEYLHGISLEDYLRQIPRKRLYLSQAVEIILQVTGALQYAHDHKVIHRDIKPANILLTLQDGAADYVKILDFGIARLRDQEALTRVSDGIPGTPAYAAPEMFQGEADYLRPALDMYALGIMLFESIVGEPPFTGTDMRLMFQHQNEVPPRLSQKLSDVNVPPELDSLVARLLGKKPESRPGAADVLEQLMVIRPKLPARSLQSILYMQTQVLARVETGAAPPSGQKDPVPSNLAKVQPLLNELDSLETILSQAGEQLAKHTRVALRRVWPGRSPPEIERLVRSALQLEAAEESAGVQLALMKESLEQARLAATNRDAARRERYLALREEELAAPDHRAAAAIRLLIAELDDDKIAPTPNGPIPGEMERDQLRLQELRTQLQQQRLELARTMLHESARLASPLTPEQAQVLRALEAALQTLESAYLDHREVSANLPM